MSGTLTGGGMLCTVDLLVPTWLEQLFLLKILFIFFTKQGTLIRRSTVLSLQSIKSVFPDTPQHSTLFGV
jgi:hypothetical protein